jgi:6-phosphofructo-2-kinase
MATPGSDDQPQQQEPSPDTKDLPMSPVVTAPPPVHPPSTTAAGSCDPNSPGTTGGTSHDATFFDPKNQDAKAVREKLAMDTLDEAIHWLSSSGGKVAIHDATNSTKERRRAILERVSHERNINVVFIESICTDTKVLESNIRMKLQGPDYIHMDPEEALKDFKARMVNYERAYEEISEDEEHMDISYIKIINVGKKCIAHNIQGYIASQCVSYLMQIHIKDRIIWLTRHGESGMSSHLSFFLFFCQHILIVLFSFLCSSYY